MDGSRVNVAIAPIAVDGPLVSIRKFSKSPLTLDRLVEYNAIPDIVAQFLWAACKARITILISGGTGSGKTTLLNALSQSISEKERLITIEDAAELQLQQPHVARMETRPPNIEGRGEIKQRGLVKNALRMRPDRVILGEVRGEEAFDMLQAMNTGHEGSMATLHANTPRDALTRLEQMVAMGDMKITPEAVAGQIASAVGLIVQATRLSDGQRKITSVAEVTGMEGPVIQMQELFNFTRTGTGPKNEVIGEFRSTGIRPKCLEDILTLGIPLPDGLFEQASQRVQLANDRLRRFAKAENEVEALGQLRRARSMRTDGQIAGLNIRIALFGQTTPETRRLAIAGCIRRNHPISSRRSSCCRRNGFGRTGNARPDWK